MQSDYKLAASTSQAFLLIAYSTENRFYLSNKKNVAQKGERKKIIYNRKKEKKTIPKERDNDCINNAFV